jgi:hypothetical protein
MPTISADSFEHLLRSVVKVTARADLASLKDLGEEGRGVRRGRETAALQQHTLKPLPAVVRKKVPSIASQPGNALPHRAWRPRGIARVS